MDTSEPEQIHLEKPPLFTVGAKLLVKYRSPQATSNDRNPGVIVFVIADEDGILVLEEYRNFDRKNEHRHILLDTETMDVFSQTELQTQRIGQATTISLSAPPWKSTWDTIAGGLAANAKMLDRYHPIEEGIYEFVDPDRLEGYEDWSPDVECDSPLPEKLIERNPDTAYSPEFTIDL